MRIERVAAAEPEAATIGPGTLILAAIGCFAIGFAVLMMVPRIWPRYVQTATVATPEPVKPIEAGVELPRPAPKAAVPGVITEIRPAGAAPEPQKVAAYRTLAELAECKAAIRAGGTFETMGPEQIAALLGTRGKPPTGAQIDAACRKLTE